MKDSLLIISSLLLHIDVFTYRSLTCYCSLLCCHCCYCHGCRWSYLIINTTSDTLCHRNHWSRNDNLLRRRVSCWCLSLDLNLGARDCIQRCRYYCCGSVGRQWICSRICNNWCHLHILWINYWLVNFDDWGYGLWGWSVSHCLCRCCNDRFCLLWDDSCYLCHRGWMRVFFRKPICVVLWVRPILTFTSSTAREMTTFLISIVNCDRYSTSCWSHLRC